MKDDSEGAEIITKRNERDSMSAMYIRNAKWLIQYTSMGVNE